MQPYFNPTRRFMQKNGSPPPPKEIKILTKFSKLDFEPILKKIINRTIISFVQPQPNSIQNKNNQIGCGTAPGNLVIIYLSIQENFKRLFLKTC